MRTVSTRLVISSEDEGEDGDEEVRVKVKVLCCVRTSASSGLACAVCW